MSNEELPIRLSAEHTERVRLAIENDENRVTTHSWEQVMSNARAKLAEAIDIKERSDPSSTAEQVKESNKAARESRKSQ